MGRRRGGDKLFSKNKEKTKKDHARKKAEIAKKILVLMAFEGEKTEPNYFDSLLQDFIRKGLIAKKSVVFVPHNHTDPKGVLDDLLTYEKDGLKSRDFQSRWIIIDRDFPRTNGGGHTAENFNNAINRAREYNVRVAYSNPCFEIWLLLHFHYRQTSIDRDELLKELESKFGYTKNSEITYHILESMMDIAIRNAKRLKAIYETFGRQVQPESDNPVTTIFELIEFLKNPK
jgi:hypothetical protein